MTKLVVRMVGGSRRSGPGESVLTSIIEVLDVYRRVLSISELRKASRGFTRVHKHQGTLTFGYNLENRRLQILNPSTGERKGL